MVTLAYTFLFTKTWQLLNIPLHSEEELRILKDFFKLSDCAKYFSKSKRAHPVDRTNSPRNKVRKYFFLQHHMCVWYSMVDLVYNDDKLKCIVS